MTSAQLKIGQRIRRRAAERRLTQSDVAAALDTSRDFVAKLYAGRKKGVSFAQMAALCELLDISADQLLGIPRHPSPLPEAEMKALVAEIEASIRAKFKKS